MMQCGVYNWYTRLHQVTPGYMSKTAFRVNDLVLLYDMKNEGFITTFSDDKYHYYYRSEYVDDEEYDIKVGEKYMLNENIDPINSVWKIGFNLPSKQYYFTANKNPHLCLSDNLQYTYKICKNKFHLSTAFTAYCLFEIENNLLVNHCTGLEQIKVIPYIIPSIRKLRSRESGA